MATKCISKAANGISGSLTVPGDKSISHRAVMFGAIANGDTIIHNFLKSEDCLATVRCFQALGVPIKMEDDNVIVTGNGFEALKKPKGSLYVGNSGTTIRLLLGILSTLPFETSITGDESIAKRPMGRVVKPLTKMGATFSGCNTPIVVKGTNTTGVQYDSPVASAQVKSAILLAALNSTGTTIITEPWKSRDHTERMLKYFNIPFSEKGNVITLRGKQQLKAREITVPGDISSAAFLIAAAIITPYSKIEIHNVGLNDTRTGIIDVLRKMGASITLCNMKEINGEEVGTIVAEYTPEIKGVEIAGKDIPRLIDEIPVIALVATQAKGNTVIRDATELKVKETNRIEVVVNELNKCGANIEETEDGMSITGGTPLHHGRVSSHGDHRIGMMLAIAGMISEGGMTIDAAEAVSVSYPNFFYDLEALNQ